MDYTMLLSDIFVSTALSYLSFALFRFLYAAYCNRGMHGVNSVEHDHFIEHTIAGGVGFVGCVVGAVMSAVHLVLQNTGDYTVPPHIEIIANISYGMLFIAAALFVHHMIKEETPTHKFYYLHMPKGVEDLK